MKTKAALLMQQPGRWEVVEADLDQPEKYEVLVKMAYSGLCHSDAHIARADARLGHLPYCGGHEGAGVVVEVGSAVRSLRPGDHIVTSFIPSCGRCQECAAGRQNLCDNGALMMLGSQLDGGYRMHYQGTDVGRSGLMGCFSEYSVMSEWSCIRVSDDLSLRAAALLGCGVPTGWGSAVYGAQVRPGQVVIVMGVGGIGINAVQGAAHAGATRVIAVDPVAMKRDTALKVGATDAVASIEEAAELARELTNGQGADATIVTVGHLEAEHVGAAFDSVRKGGTAVVTSAGRMADVGIPISPFMLAMYQKRIQGCLFGMMSPAAAVPMFVRMYEQGQLKLDELVTRTYPIEAINAGYEDMQAGVNIRGVIEFPGAP